MKRVEKPWGHEVWWAHTERYVGKLLHIRKGHRLSLQYHQQKDETIMVLSGCILFAWQNKGESEESTKTLHPHEPVDIPHGMQHRLTAIEDTVLVEVSSPEVDDIVRLDDDYSRVLSK